MTEIERLKAENASLLESLREAEKERDEAYRSANAAAAEMANWRTMADRNTTALAAAEQRAEAAEKRNMELQGALRAAPHDWLCLAVCIIEGAFPVARGMPPQTVRPRTPYEDALCNCWKRAALHDEERRQGEEK